MDPSSPLASPPSSANAGGSNGDVSLARLTSARDQEIDDDDPLSKPPFLVDNDGDDGASTSSSSSAVSTSTTIAEAEADEPSPPTPPIMRLPEEMLSCIFAFLPPVAVGRASCVCAAWREAATGYDAAIWREALSKALGSRAAAEAARRALAVTSDASSSAQSSSSPATSPSLSLPPPSPPLLLPTWRRTFLATPAPRCDGIYVSRESYIRTGLTEWTVRNPVHVVVYFRYYRFFPPEQQQQQQQQDGEVGEGEGAAAEATTAATTVDASASATPATPSSLKPPRGRFWYRTTPDPPAKAARSLALGPPRATAAAASSEKSTVVEGRYRIGGGSGDSSSAGKRGDPSVLRTAWRVRNSAGTEVRAKLRLRCAGEGERRLGAWDRMDVLALASHDLASGLTLPFSTQQQGRDNEDGDDNGVAAGGFPSATVRRGRQQHQQQQPQPPRAPPPPLAHKRGLSTFVFIPWGGVEDSPLNLPLSQMDCWIPG